MHKSIALFFAVLAPSVCIAMCGGSSATPCTAGQSIGCVGVGGCTGFQVCKSDGTYDTCNCGGGGDGGADTSSTADTGANDTGLVDTSSEIATGDGATWTPASLTGLSLWLDDTVGVVQDSSKTGYVRRWLDQSGKGNNADVLNYGLAEPQIDPSVLNGHDALIVQYTSVYFTESLTADLEFGSGDFLLGFVARLDTPDQYHTYYLWNEPSNGPYGIGVYQDQSANLTLNILGTANKAVVANPNTSKFHIVIATGALLELRVDTASATGPTNTNDTTSTGASPGIMDGMNSAQDEIAEVIAVKGTVSSTDVSNLQAYWKKKFAL